ncbi:hypothetical protein MPH_05534 [Macrophomina phaseolina MS6]|uniref:SnoaL-like domain-containing protein n=1 Tax=Macrophomina phaseolina (strain MS6) TaxID=1126212 RepID=K2S3Z4_MACPH|nr:hypothetical protein MPH_05534 [Macrophomina phaseolina MS6]
MSSAADGCPISPSPPRPDCLQLQPAQNNKKRPRKSRRRQPAPTREPTPPSAGDYDSDASTDSTAEAAVAERATMCELHCLLRSYATYASARQWRTWADLFVEDVVFSFEYCAQIHGRKELYHGGLGMDELPFHSVFFSDIRIELDPCRPRERATCTANMWFTRRNDQAEGLGICEATLDVPTNDEKDEQPVTANCDYCGPYGFEFVNTDEGWKIKTMALKVLNERREEVDRCLTKCICIPSSSCGTPCR